MSWSYSSGVLTQTGTDADLSGLTGLTGVTVTTISGGLTTYNCGTNRIILQGNQTIAGTSAPLESLIIGQNNSDTANPDIVVRNGATLTLGHNRTVSGFIGAIPYHTVMYEPGSDKGYAQSTALNMDPSAWMHVLSGGTLNWLSGVIDHWGGIGFQAGSTINIGFSNMPSPPVLHTNRVRRTGSDPAQSLYNYATNTNIYGLRIIGAYNVASTAYAFAQLAVPNLFKGYEPQFIHYGLAGSLTLPSGTFTFNNYAGAKGSIADIWKRTGGTSIFDLRNCVVGTNLTLVSSTGNFTVRVSQDVAIHINDDAGGDVEGALVYFVDTLSNAYSDTTDANGDVSWTGVITGVSASGTSTITKRFGSTDSATHYIYAYGRQIRSYSHSMRGADGTTVDSPIPVDIYITETDRSVVQAYSTHDTVDEIYDAYVDWKYTLANLNKPSLSAMHLNGAGTTLSFSSYSMTLNSGAASTSFSNIGTTGAIIKPSGTATDGNTFPTGISFTTGKYTITSGDTSSVTIAGGIVAPAGAIYSGINTIGNGQLSVFGSQSVLTGSAIVQNGGTLELSDVTTDIITATVRAGGTIKISGAATTQTIDLKNVTFESGAFLENTSGTAITYIQIAGQQSPTEVETSGTLTLNNDIPVSWSTIVDGTKYQIYDVTAATELEIGTTSGGAGIDTTIPATSLGNTIRIRTAKDGGPGNAKRWLEVNRTAIESGIEVTDVQTGNAVYNTNGFNGASQTDFTWNDTELRWEITPTGDNQEYLVAKLYAYEVYWETTDEGIRRGQQITGNTRTEYGFPTLAKVFNTDTGTYATPILTGAVAVDGSGNKFVPIVPCQAGVTVGIGFVFADSGYNPTTVQQISDTLVNTQRVDGLLEDDGFGNDRFTAKALETSPVADVSNLALETTAQSIKTKTDNLPASPAAVGSLMTLEDGAITLAKFTVGAIDSTVAPNLDVAVSTRLPTSGYIAPDNIGISDAKTAAESVDSKLTILRASNLDNLDTTVSSRSDFDNTVDEVITDAASRTASQADVSALALETTSQSIKTRTDSMPIFGEDFYAQDLDTTITKHLNNTKLAP